MEANREKINEHRRNKYDSGRRKEEYQQKREDILRRAKEDRLSCPICTIQYRRLYLKVHLQNRHKLDDVQLQQVLTKPAPPELVEAQS